MKRLSELAFYEKIGTKISWSIVISSLVLLVVVFIFFLKNLDREKRFMKKLLLEKGSTIIRAFEASTKAGLLYMGWESFQIQKMISAVGTQEGVVYIFICNQQGRAFAHTNPDEVGHFVISVDELNNLSPGIVEKFRIKEYKDKKIFEVYKVFKPIISQRMMCPGMGYKRNGREIFYSKMWCTPENLLHRKFFIFVGLDMSPFEAAQRVDLRNAIVISLVLVLLGVAGIYLSNIVGQYQKTKGKLDYTSAFAQTVVSNLPVGLIVLSPDNRIVFANRSALDIVKKDNRSIVGKMFDHVFSKEFVDAVSELSSKDKFIEKEINTVLKEDGYQPVAISANKIISKDGKNMGRLVIIKDLKEIKKLQEQIQRKERLASLGGLAAGIAHEIRNPLSSIKGMATYYIQKFPSESEEGRIGKILVQEVNRLNRVISELLEFAKPVSLNLKEAKLKELIDHTVRLISEDVKEKNINISIDIEPEELTVQVDPDRFIQCLLNLFINSLEAMDRGGNLKIIAKRLNYETVVEISDTGIGISKENIKKIFDPYFTTKSTGTGLGLAIVHKIIEAHEGRIEVNSTPGRGTTFKLFFKSA